MLLNHHTSRNFRNLAEEETSFHPRANILVGRNGQGKTNLLESIYFLATTKSFRTSRIQPVFRFGEQNVFVSGRLDRGGVEKTLSVGLEAGDARHRVLTVNGGKVTLAAYLEQLTVFAYSSARLDVLRGTPEERRRFLDRGIASVQPGYLADLSRYGRVLRQRNALLTEIAQGRESPDSLDAWDEELQMAAGPVHRARGQYAEALAGELGETLVRHAYHVRDVDLQYRPSRLDRIHELRRAELRARVTLAGPQRDAIEFSVDGRPAAAGPPGGELKMVVLFLKFSKIELYRRRQDEAPVFLLDDVDAELDLDILQDLLAGLPASTQLFATSAKEAFLASLEAGPHRRLSIENGRVSRWHDFG